MERAASPNYSGTAILLHWLVALGIVAALVLIWSLPGRNDPNRAVVLAYHKTAGTAVLVIAAMRLARRLRRPVAPYPGLSPLERRLSGLTHAALYALMVLMPVTGYVFSTLEGQDLALFNLVSIPPTLAKDRALARAIETIHVLGQWLVYAFVALHVAGALVHRFVRRDGVLARMLPLRRE
jgi:cytochrome b561